jgi:D-inositol-3-phosphate glycosyltransferase
LRTLGAQAVSHAAAFSWANTAEKLLDSYTAALTGPGHTPAILGESQARSRALWRRRTGVRR